MTAYLAVTAHWITADWVLRSEVLGFSELEGSHSGENIGQELNDLIKKFEISDRLQNITADNVSVNDKAVCIVGNELDVDGYAFDAQEQRSQYTTFTDFSADSQLITINSCFSHAVAIGEGSFLSALSPRPKAPKVTKVASNAATLQKHSESNTGELDDDNKDTEEEIEDMLKELETATSNLECATQDLGLTPHDEKLLKTLLLKIRGFIAKVGVISES
jgi:hypothetical protein